MAKIHINLKIPPAKRVSEEPPELPEVWPTMLPADDPFMGRVDVTFFDAGTMPYSLFSIITASIPNYYGAGTWAFRFSGDQRKFFEHGSHVAFVYEIEEEGETVTKEVAAKVHATYPISWQAELGYTEVLVNVTIEVGATLTDLSVWIDSPAWIQAIVKKGDQQAQFSGVGGWGQTYRTFHTTWNYYGNPYGVDPADINSEYTESNENRWKRKPLGVVTIRDADKRWEQQVDQYNIRTELVRSPDVSGQCDISPDLSEDGECRKGRIQEQDPAQYRSGGLSSKLHLRCSEIGSQSYGHYLNAPLEGQTDIRYYRDWLDPQGIFFPPFDTSDQTNFKVTRVPTFDVQVEQEVTGAFIMPGKKVEVYWAPRIWGYYARNRVAHSPETVPVDTGDKLNGEDAFWDRSWALRYLAMVGILQVSWEERQNLLRWTGPQDSFTLLGGWTNYVLNPTFYNQYYIAIWYDRFPNILSLKTPGDSEYTSKFYAMSGDNPDGRTAIDGMQAGTITTGPSNYQEPDYAVYDHLGNIVCMQPGAWHYSVPPGRYIFFEGDILRVQIEENQQITEVIYYRCKEDSHIWYDPGHYVIGLTPWGDPELGGVYGGYDPIVIGWSGVAKGALPYLPGWETYWEELDLVDSALPVTLKGDESKTSVLANAEPAQVDRILSGTNALHFIHSPEGKVASIASAEALGRCGIPLSTCPSDGKLFETTHVFTSGSLLPREVFFGAETDIFTPVWDKVASTKFWGDYGDTLIDDSKYDRMDNYPYGFGICPHKAGQLCAVIKVGQQEFYVWRRTDEEMTLHGISEQGNYDEPETASFEDAACADNAKGFEGDFFTQTWGVGRKITHFGLSAAQLSTVTTREWGPAPDLVKRSELRLPHAISASDCLYELEVPIFIAFSKERAILGVTKDEADGMPLIEYINTTGRYDIFYRIARSDETSVFYTVGEDSEEEALASGAGRNLR